MCRVYIYVVYTGNRESRHHATAVTLSYAHVHTHVHIHIRVLLQMHAHVCENICTPTHADRKREGNMFQRTTTHGALQRTPTHCNTTYCNV